MSRLFSKLERCMVTCCRTQTVSVPGQTSFDRWRRMCLIVSIVDSVKVCYCISI